MDRLFLIMQLMLKPILKAHLWTAWVSSCFDKRNGSDIGFQDVLPVVGVIIGMTPEKLAGA